MKKIVLIILSLFTVNTYCQMLSSGDAVVELNMGFPNVMPVFVDAGGNFHGGFDVFGDDVKKFGQLGVKGEFFMADKIGVIAALNYGYFRTRSYSTYSEYDPNTSTYNEVTYYYDTQVHKFRITAGLNIHTVRTARVDSYFGFMAGTKNVNMNYTTNDPNATGNSIPFTIPFALRIHYGLRYFFNESFAANFELGLGGPLICAGVTYKIPSF